MKTALKILLLYIGFYLFASGTLNQCIKLFKSATFELSVMDYCEDTSANEEDKDDKDEQKLFTGFLNDELLPLFIYKEKIFPSLCEDKLSTMYSEIVPPPPKA
jgi:hypothetical protein